MQGMGLWISTVILELGLSITERRLENIVVSTPIWMYRTSRGGSRWVPGVKKILKSTHNRRVLNCWLCFISTVIKSELDYIHFWNRMNVNTTWAWKLFQEQVEAGHAVRVRNRVASTYLPWQSRSQTGMIHDPPYQRRGMRVVYDFQELICEIEVFYY